jgi:hypothetical protein
MKRTLFVMALVLGLATAAGAATLTVASDKPTYNVGETITLTVSGDGAGATAYSLIGRLLYSGAGSVTPQTQVQNSAGTPPWIVGPITNGPGFSEAFNQIDGSFAGSPENFPGNLVATVTLLAAGAGAVNIDWFNNLSFFDIQGAQSANASFTINGGGPVVPEPTTAAMLALGLFGLALGGRRRS